MRLALSLSYSGASMTLDMTRILEAERLGYDSVWSAEAYGSDAVTPAAWIAARTERIHVGTATIMPTHSAAKWYQRQVRCSGPVGARSEFHSASPFSCMPAAPVSSRNARSCRIAAKPQAKRRACSRGG